MSAQYPDTYRGRAERGYAWPVGCVFILVGLIALGVWGLFVVGADIYAYLKSHFELPVLHWAVQLLVVPLIWLGLVLAVFLAGISLRKILQLFLPDTRFEFDTQGLRIRRGGQTIKSIAWDREYKCHFYEPSPLLDADGEALDPDFAVLVVEQGLTRISVWIPYFPRYISKEQRAALPKWPDDGHRDIELISPATIAFGHEEILQDTEFHRRILTLSGYPAPKGWLEKLAKRRSA